MHVACIGIYMKKISMRINLVSLKEEPRLTREARIMKKKLFSLMILVYLLNMKFVCFLYEFFVNKI